MLRPLHRIFIALLCLALPPSSVPGLAGAATSPAAVVIGKTAILGSGWYPRVIRLRHGPAASNGRLIASTGVGAGLGAPVGAHGIFQSTNDGATFTPLGSVRAAAGSSERCCSTLFELPVAVGALSAGTLLSAGSYFSGTTPAIEIYVSTDQGATWSYGGTPAIRGAGKRGGLWEPEFTIARDGALVMFWSDETDPCCSQKLVQMRSYDGKTWRDTRNTVAARAPGARPGMARISRLPDGHYFMSYEICGPRRQCIAYSRTSADGWNFGSPSDLGTRIVSSTGQYFEHAPDNAWTAKSGSNGALLVIGQVLHEADGRVSPGNGQLLFVNTSVDGTGSWSVEPAPVPVPDAYSNPCPNYSDTLLPSADGSELMELAADFDSSQTCHTYYGTLPQ